MSIKIPLLRLESVLPSSPSHVTRFCDFAVPADSSCLVTTPLVPDADKQRGCSANHGSIGDSWPIAFSGCPRGHRVSRETRCSKHLRSLTGFWILTLEPERLENQPVILRDESGMDSRQTLKLLVVLDVRRRNELLSSKRSR